jgi:hypothetical protein
MASGLEISLSRVKVIRVETLSLINEFYHEDHEGHEGEATSDDSSI